MYLLVFLATGIATTAVASPPRVDRVKNIITLTKLVQEKDGAGSDMVVKNYLLQGAVDEEHKLKAMNFSYSVMGARWTHVQCHDIAWLVDGKSWVPANSQFRNFMQGTVAIEAWILALTRDELAHLAAAQRVEFRVCNDRMHLDAEFMQDLKDFGPALDEQLKGNSSAEGE